MEQKDLLTPTSAVLGGQSKIPKVAAVLGGIEGYRHQLKVSPGTLKFSSNFTLVLLEENLPQMMQWVYAKAVSVADLKMHNHRTPALTTLKTGHFSSDTCFEFRVAKGSCFPEDVEVFL